MIVQFMIDEIEGIMILLTRKPDQKVLTALKSLEPKDIKDYRDSLAEEWAIKHKGKKLLLAD
jgi:uncharacterized membrane protein YgcG